VTYDAWAPKLPTTPFRGLAPLRYLDQPIFFGRDRETQLLHRLVVIYRGVLLYGDSGIGKSSLLNAGLIPAIEGEGIRAERVRVQPRAGEELVVERISLDEAGTPPYLPSALVGGDSPSAVFSVSAFRRRLTEIAGAAATSLLVFDQFEELVTLFLESAGSDASTDARMLQRDVLELLDELLTDASLPVKLLFAFREDYLAKLLDLLGAHTQLKSQYVRLAPLGREELRTIVLGPFERFPDAFQRPIPPSLADRLVEAILARGDAAGGDRLSELQLACQRLWRSSDPERLFTEHGLQAILEEELSASIDQLDEAARDTAVTLLGHLVTRSGARNVVSEEDLVERVQRETGVTSKELRAVLLSLERESRLVRREVRHEVVFYEIVSEFLIPWIVRRRARAEITRQKVTTPDSTSFVSGGARYLAGVTPTSWRWREEALARTAELAALAAALTPGKAEDQPTRHALEAVAQHLRAARDIVSGRSERGPYRRFVTRLGGSAVERAAAHIDAAQAGLLSIAPAEYLRRQLPSLVAHVQLHLPADDPRRVRMERMERDVAERIDPSDVLDRGREAIVSAVRASSAAARRDVVRARSFRTIVLVTAALLAVLAAALAVVGAANPAWLPVCFDTGGAGGQASVVCPTSEAVLPRVAEGLSNRDVEEAISRTASSADILVVELVGVSGGAVTGAAALRRSRGLPARYSLPVALALLKLPTGAFTAVLGLLLLRGGFVPGLTTLDSSAQIIAYALVFGAAQQLFTGLVDKQAHLLLADAAPAGTAGLLPSASGSRPVMSARVAPDHKT
jgi:hypothetical protein